jgi:hypothetical protein
MLEVALRLNQHYTGQAGDPYSPERKTWPRCLFRIVPVEIVSWAGAVHHPRYQR